MSLNNKIKQQGFTIVELLIVIVVIGILAAITIVAYNGIQNRGKAAAAQSLANAVVKKAEAWNTIQSSYPSYCQLTTGTTNATGTTTCTAGATAGPVEAKLDDASKVSATAPGNESTVLYKTCTTGAQVQYWDATVPGLKFVGIGGGSSTAACV